MAAAAPSAGQSELLGLTDEPSSLRNVEQPENVLVPQPLRDVRAAGGDISLGTPESPHVPFKQGPSKAFSDTPHPFGWELFADGSKVARTIGINPNYVISPGDKIAIQMWGAQTTSGVLTVDIQGNIFLPEVGPVRVAGLTQRQLSQAVNTAMARVYTEQVRVYTNLLNTQPVGVYVTGAVARPGRIPGERNDSLLYYIAQAGGIDLERGSFRDIQVLRNGTVLAQADLYEFLLRGGLPNIAFEDNDTIIVGPIGSTITVRGDVRNAYQFEIGSGPVEGEAALAMVKPLPRATHIAVRGVRNGLPYNTYLSLQEFQKAVVRDGDRLEIQSDLVENTIFVTVVGRASGPSAFAVPRGTTLSSILDMIAVDPAVADVEAIYLRRLSVAERQKRALELSLENLQRAVLTTESSTPSEAQIRAQEAKLVERFVDKARAVEPEGRVVLGDRAGQNRLLLEPEDVIVIPQKSNLVMVSGEVQMPQTLVYTDELGVSDYIAQAGGLTDRADEEKVLIMSQSGAVSMDGDAQIRPGDHIMILPTAGDKRGAIIRDMVEIIYRIAVSAGVVINVLDD